MWCSASALEHTVLRRLEELQSPGTCPALGLAHVFRSVLQAQSSSAGLEWSSTDGHDDGQQDQTQVKVDVGHTSLAPVLDAWASRLMDAVQLAANKGLDRPVYLAAAHWLAQAVLSAIHLGAAAPVTPAALEAAWQEDAAGAPTVPAERLMASLAALAAVACTDGSAAAASACLSSLLEQLGSEAGAARWSELLAAYSAESGGADGDAAAEGEVSAQPGNVLAGEGAQSADEDEYDDGDGDEEGDGEEAADVAPASDKSSSEGASEQAAPGPVKGADATAAAQEPTSAEMQAGGEDDDALSLGLSRPASNTSITSAVEPLPAPPAPSVPRPPPRAASNDGLPADLARQLSAASSTDLPDDLPTEADLLKGAAVRAHVSTKPAGAGNAGPGIGPGAKGPCGKGAGLSDELRSWADFKEKAATHGPPAAASPPRARQGPLVPIAGHGPAASDARDQHHKAGRADAAASSPQRAGQLSPLPAGAAAPLRQGSDPEHSPRHGALSRQPGGAGSGAGSGVGTPDRGLGAGRSMARHLSRKQSVSEPGPHGPQAEWRQLPSLGQAARMHPHEALRQSSHTAAGAAPGPGGPPRPVPGAAALPSLPALAGARGSVPKGMELVAARRPSLGRRSLANSANNSMARLPGLGPGGRGGGGPRAFRLPSKKSFKADNQF